MVFIKAHPNRLLQAGSLAVAVTALTVTACGGGGAAALAPGSGRGQWTKAEVSQFTAAAGVGANASQKACAVKYVEQNMSFANAMELTSVGPSSDGSASAAQIKAALVGKYGPAEGNALNAQLEQVLADWDNSCAGLATSSATPGAASAPTADPAATSESSCTVDCTNPIASGESGWLAQVQEALQNVQQDLTNISSDSSGGPGDLTLDGAELDQDASAALDPNDDPPPADNADWVTAMNDYAAAGAGLRPLT